MTETISITFSDEDLKTFKETTGMSIGDCIKILMNSVKYGGKLELDPFWSDENQMLLRKIREDAEHGRNMHEHKLIEVE